MNQATLTREDVLKRLQVSKQRKKERLKELEVELRAEYKKRTGTEAKFFNAW